MKSLRSLKAWIEAMRLRTLPVSIAGVLAGGGVAAYFNQFHWLPFSICLLFAILAQIASNFANEYFDFKKGIDKKGREGFRRGVTEGDISPSSMKIATFSLLALDSLLGLSLIYWGGWWLIPVGIAIAIFAIAYSAGPYPLSHHCLGEVTVFIFFGLVPVMFTAYLQTQSWQMWPIALPIALAIGCLGANVLIVNNYRDINDDRIVGKHTLAGKFGAKFITNLYMGLGVAAVILIEIATATRIPYIWQTGPLVYINIHYILWQKMCNSEGAELNPILGKTAMLMCALSIWLFTALAVNHINIL